jgi:hypothetical protein
VNGKYKSVREEIAKYARSPSLSLTYSHTFYSFRNIYTYKKGITLLLRDSLDMSVPLSSSSESSTESSKALTTGLGPNIPPDNANANGLSKAFYTCVCITDHKATVREIVRVPGSSITTTTLSSSSAAAAPASVSASSLSEKLLEELKKDREWVFEYNANSFFQNNNPVLGGLVVYVRDAMLRLQFIPPMLPPPIPTPTQTRTGLTPTQWLSTPPPPHPSPPHNRPNHQPRRT